MTISVLDQAGSVCKCVTVQKRTWYMM